MDNPLARVGIVVIGRNEGMRLRRCLESVVHAGAKVVYVDSGSTDGSVAMARDEAVEVVELDQSAPFCAARARNAGCQRLFEANPATSFVQFVDGDCEIHAEWLGAAVKALESRPELAIVAGWLRERAPEVSIYNRLGDVEWNFGGAGEVDSVGGIFMIRREAFDAVGGFDPSIAAGEEPEICLRLSRRGWRMLRIDRSMASHDLAMTRFGQWWRRQVRFGYGSADVAARFALPRFRRSNLRARVWTAWLVAALMLGSLAVMIPLTGNAGLLALMFSCLWPAQLGRIALRIWRGGQSFGLAAAYAFFLMLSYWPQMAGQLLYSSDRLRRRAFRLIEHKVSGESRSERGS